MPTFKSKVFKHHKQGAGSYNVKIIVCHQIKRKYLDTEYYVSDRMLKRTKRRFRIDDPIILTQLNLKRFDVQMFCGHLISREETIAFREFCREHIAAFKAVKRGKSASNYARAFKQKFGKAPSLIVWPRAHFRYSSTPRQLKRLN